MELDNLNELQCSMNQLWRREEKKFLPMAGRPFVCDQRINQYDSSAEPLSVVIVRTVCL